MATIDSELHRALEILRSGGPEKLSSYLARQGAARRAEVYVVDRSGRDVIDGTDRSAMLSQTPGFQIPYLGRSARVRVVRMGDHSYSMITFVARLFNFTEFFSYYSWTFLSIVLLSWWLAVDLGRPLRSLRLAVEEFGRGDLTSRSGTSRKDEIGQLAAAFDRMANRIQSLVTAERRLLQDISHELRSPLTRLSCAIEIARNRGDADGTLLRIHKESQRLNNLVNELLEVASGEGDPSATRREPVNLNELMDTILYDCRIEADTKRCKLNFNANAGVEIQGDSELLRRAAENVLRNAIRYAPVGTAIDVELMRQAGSASLSIRDRGPGVSEELLTDIFKPFFRVENHRGQDGVGLGLALSQRAIALHRGTIRAENASPGLNVTIQLPLDAEPAKWSDGALAHREPAT
ncbi:MAG: ATP-binding protein [Bryobacteraceae bacterium]